MAKVWTITAVDVKGGKLGSFLVGCHIIENATAYDFTAPDVKVVLGTTAGSTLPTGTFAFSGFSFKGPIWLIAASATTTNQIQGIWGATFAGKEGTGDESGTWTAQAGSGEGGDKDEEAHRRTHKPRARATGRS